MTAREHPRQEALQWIGIANLRNIEGETDAAQVAALLAIANALLAIELTL